MRSFLFFFALQLSLFFFFFPPPASFVSHANPNTVLFLKEGTGGNFGLSA